MLKVCYKFGKKMENNSIFIEKLRSSGLRPTKQRLEICKLLFDRKKTFHFTIADISTILKKRTNKRISLATVYNTIHSFKKKFPENNLYYQCIYFVLL